MPDARGPSDERGASRPSRDLARAFALSGAPLALVSTDGRLVEANESLARTLGVAASELVAKAFDELVHRDDRPTVVTDLRALFEQGRPFSFESRALCRDGSFRWLFWELAPLDDGATALAIGIDITERKQAEEALQRSEARFRQLSEGSPDAIAVHRLGRLVYVNRALVNLLGHSPADLLGAPFVSIVHPDDRARFEEWQTAPAPAGQPWPTRELKLVGKQGEVVAECVAIDVDFDGALATCVLARDVTDRRRLEARLVHADRLAALGTLAAGVAHEINNPLTYVLLNLQLLDRTLVAPADETTSDRMRERIAEAREGAERVGAIVRELRAFSRAEDERRGPADLRVVLEAAVKMASRDIRPRARLVKEWNEVPVVDANEARLTQVFLNLLINAAHAIPDGEPDENEIRVRASTDAAGRAVVEVSDTGSGMPREIVSRIFDPFFTTKPLGEGTGLGLSVCHGIVTSLGGDITVESQLGAGTTFRVRLPPLRATTTPSQGSMFPRLSDPAPIGARILVIDDEPALRNALASCLRDRHEVVVAEGGREALRILIEDPRFDLVLCDLMMPDLSGAALHEELRKSHPALAERMVFMTGGAFTPRMHEFVARVGSRILEKPIDLSRIDDLLRRARRRARASGVTPP